MIDASRFEPERIRPLSRLEYERLVELGIFEDERIELLEGALVELSPQKAQHVYVVSRLIALLTPKLRDRAMLVSQGPVALSASSEPEPDVYLVEPGDYRRRLPRRPLLVVEVADTTLAKDRGIKLEIYARAEVPEYWIVNLVDSVVEVHRAPKRGRYTERSVFERGETLALLAFPDLRLRVAELLP